MTAPAAFVLSPAPADYQGAKVHSKPTFRDGSSVTLAGKYVTYLKDVLADVELSSKGDHFDMFKLKEAISEAASRAESVLEVVEEEEIEDEELLNISAREWKKQDHYAILGLSKLRYKATPDDIIKQHRKKVLKHHPDKKIAAAGGVLNPQFDEYYKCIQKAYETLIDPVRRRQFDSVDPGFEDFEPVTVNKKDFFKVYGPVFELEGRFSKKQPVPPLGNAKSTKEQTESFYNFFYNFDSWRSFEYLDQEETEGSENRDNKRYIEKKNKNARDKAKKEDNARLRTLVDEVLKQDPRIAKYKEEDKKKRNFKKDQREAEEKLALEKKLKEEQEAARIAQEALEAEKALKENAKKDKEAVRRIIKKEKKTLKSILKDNNYLLASPEPATPEQIGARLDELDKIIAANKEAESLTKVRTELEAALSSGTGNDVFISILSTI
ncbi:Zuotin [Smittium mucronatum]|uniref:Zuotin n=1 Tax=Smittium mucronatum TaxID=133383 RepID=A0A1R0GN40_9FUNG|nr:Zuotin [Smittium mucronatum]